MSRPRSSFKVALKSHEFPLPFQFIKMNEIKQEILETLILSEDHKYDSKSNVSPENMKAFIQYLIDGKAPEIDNHNFNDFSLLSNEFQIPIVKKSIVCSPFGVIKNFLIQTNGNIGAEINVTSSSIYSKGREPEKGISFDDDSQSFASQNVQNSWLCIEIINHEIVITGYYFKAYNGGPGTGNPKSWILEGSKDNTTWELIDQQNDCPFLNGSSFSHIFQVKNPNNKHYKFVRIKQTGPSWRNDYYLIFNAIDFYGVLI